MHDRSAELLHLLKRRFEVADSEVREGERVPRSPAASVYADRGAWLVGLPALSFAVSTRLERDP